MAIMPTQYQVQDRNRKFHEEVAQRKKKVDKLSFDLYEKICECDNPQDGDFKLLTISGILAQM